MVEIIFPEATPEVYLRGIGLLRGIEERMREIPALASLAAKQGMSVGDDEVAEFLSGKLATEVHRQALAARDREERTVAPAVQVAPEMRSAVADRLDRWMRWLKMDGRTWMTSVPEAMGLPDPGREVVSLGLRIIELLHSGPARIAVASDEETLLVG